MVTPSNSPDLQPGYSVLRLEGIERLSSTQKRQLIESIAWDLKSVIIALSRYTQAGILRGSHTSSIDNILRTVADVDDQYRQSLEGELKAQKRIVVKLRRERRRLRRRLLSNREGTKKLLGMAAVAIRQLVSDLARARIRLASMEVQARFGWEGAPGARREVIDTETPYDGFDGRDGSSMNGGVDNSANGGLSAR